LDYLWIQNPLRTVPLEMRQCLRNSCFGLRHTLDCEYQDH